MAFYFNKQKYIYQGLAVKRELDLHLIAYKIMTWDYGHLQIVKLQNHSFTEETKSPAKL